MTRSPSFVRKRTSIRVLALIVVLVLTPVAVVGVIAASTVRIGGPIADALASDEAKENDLSWQLNALKSNWGVDVPDSIVLKKFYESEVGPHGEHDAVYVLKAGRVEGTWLDPDSNQLKPSHAALLNSIAKGASATDAVGDAASLACAASKGNEATRSLTVCRAPGTDNELLLLERIA